MAGKTQNSVLAPAPESRHHPTERKLRLVLTSITATTKVNVISSDCKTAYHLVNETPCVHLHPTLIPERVCDSKDYTVQLGE